MRLISEAFEEQRILHSCHSDPTSGHLGIKRTIKRIRERFTWKGLNTEVIQLVIMKSYKRMFLHDKRFLQVNLVKFAKETLLSWLLIQLSFIRFL